MQLKILGSIFIMALFYCCANNATGQQPSKHIDIHASSRNEGKYCYVLWTSDSLKANPNVKKQEVPS
jgi:hypothetical protein